MFSHNSAVGPQYTDIYICVFDLVRMLPVLQYCDVKDKATTPIIYPENFLDGWVVKKFDNICFSCMFFMFSVLFISL